MSVVLGLCIPPLMGLAKDQRQILGELFSLPKELSLALVSYYINTPPDERNMPWYDEGSWRFIYLDKGAGGSGGGVIDTGFNTLQEALQFAVDNNHL